MTDLRALLGDDRYDDVMFRAMSAVASQPHGKPYTMLERVADTLAAVLPDLLAEANTRADDAEAKARRFANLLGNNAKALNDVLPREVLRQKAEAWDEGYDVGFDEARAVQANWPARTPNPYRRGTDGTEEADR